MFKKLENIGEKFNKKVEKNDFFFEKVEKKLNKVQKSWKDEEKIGKVQKSWEKVGKSRRQKIGKKLGKSWRIFFKKLEKNWGKDCEKVGKFF